MKKGGDKPLRLEDAIVSDEVGIESGGYGIYRLRSLYQPVFERRGRTLHAVAADASVVPFVAGEPAPSEVFRLAITEGDRAFVERMCLALMLRNHRNLSVEGLSLIMSSPATGDDGAWRTDLVGFLAEQIAEAEVEQGLAVYALSRPPTLEGVDLSRLAADLRGKGLRVGIGDFGAGHWSDEQIARLEPEIVRIDGEWFQKVCREATTIRLFDSVVARLRERGLRVLVAGVATELQLGVALKSGAQLFQGDHLAPAALGGSIIDEKPLSIADKLGDARKIVPLFG